MIWGLATPMLRATQELVVRRHTESLFIIGERFFSETLQINIIIEKISIDYTHFKTRRG